ncbi:BURP domain-containing protein 3-like [Pyrus x bretschneideri]|uniref:BURP domain-containing protein 3-like n=1 Tax=Pyrus x bretschneideri TaxID=225117 RepID=UPI00202EA22C|nr:BURP domain-containing protein 3-like [Pyrus x bretschneideri]
MGFLLSIFFVFLTLTLAGSHAAALPVPPPQLYWNSVLPNTPMPKFLSQLVKPDFISVGKGGVILHNQVQKDGNWVYPKDADENLNLPLVRTLHLNAEIFDTFENGVAEEFPDDASENIVDPTGTIFFLEKDLHPGTTMNYRLAGNSAITTPFLSRKTVESIPFESSKLPEILNKFSVKPESTAANLINSTIQECEHQVARNEAKQCATSLESMIDFATAILGKNVRAIATEVEKNGAAPIQKYTITPGVKELAGNKFTVCHKVAYVYAVFYCHAIEKTRTYMVPLQGADGTKAKAVAACHEDTSGWVPNHYAFKELKVEPGTVPICHFLKVKEVTWVPNQKPN